MKKKKIKVRKTWSRSPVQSAHSTKKGKKGYSRKRDKQQAKKDFIKDLND